MAADIKLKKKKPAAEIRKRKGAEDNAREALKFSVPGAKVMKAADMRRCRVCGSMIPKVDDEPDFIVATDWYYVEVKESGQGGAFYPKGPGGFTEIQLRRFAEHRAFIFLKLHWEGRTGCYYLPWIEWDIIFEMIEREQRESINLIWMEQHPILNQWRCTWTSGQGDQKGHWSCPGWDGGVLYE